MTPRDQYFAAAVTGLLACGDDAYVVAYNAADIADAMAAEACKRWGHEYVLEQESGPCYRCGETRIVKCDTCGCPKGSGPRSCDCVPF